MVSYFIRYTRIPSLNWLILLFLDILAKLLPLCIIYYLWVTLLRCNTVWKCLPYFSTVREFDCKEVHMIYLFLSMILSSKLCSIQFKGTKEDDSTLSFYPSWNKGKCLCSWYFCLSFGLLYIWIRLSINICLSLYHLSTWTFASFFKMYVSHVHQTSLKLPVFVLEFLILLPQPPKCWVIQCWII